MSEFDPHDESSRNEVRTALLAYKEEGLLEPHFSIDHVSEHVVPLGVDLTVRFRSRSRGIEESLEFYAYPDVFALNTVEEVVANVVEEIRERISERPPSSETESPG